MIGRMSHKGDQHEFVTNLFGKNIELYKTPHLRQLYSDSYKKVLLEAKSFCSDVAMIRWTKD